MHKETHTERGQFLIVHFVWERPKTMHGMQSTDNYQLSSVIEHDERIVNTGNYYNIILYFSQSNFKTKLTSLSRTVNTFNNELSVQTPYMHTTNSQYSILDLEISSYIARSNRLSC